MKKILSVFIALSVIMSFVSCEDKKQNDTAVYEQETVEEVTEPVFMEYTDSDFTDIDVQISFQTSKPPFTVNCVDFSDADLGYRILNISEEEALECVGNIIRESYQQGDEEAKNIIQSITEMKSYGLVNSACIHDNIIYMSVNYENIVSYHSEYSVFSYNTDTKELNELYSCKNDGNGAETGNLRYINGALYLTYSCYEKKENYVSEDESPYDYYSYICRLDEENHELIKVYDGNMGFSPYPMEYSTDERLIVSVDDFGEDGKQIGRTFKEYDFSSDSWNVIYTAKLGSKDNVILTENGIALQTVDDNKNVIVETDDFRLSSQIKGKLIGCCDSTVMILQSDYLMNYTTNKLYVYNLDKMERYLLDLSSYTSRASIYSSGKNVVFNNNTGFTYCLIPEIGAVFTICTSGSIPVSCGRKTYILSSNHIDGYSMRKDGITVHYNSSELYEKKFYWWEN